MEATDIFVTVATGDPDAPYKRLNLQQMCDAIFGTLMDLKSQVGELERWAGLTDELATAVQKMQNTFTTLSQQLHGTVVQARALMAPKPQGVN